MVEIMGEPAAAGTSATAIAASRHTSALRAAVLRQVLLSYLLGAVILATTINLVAGLLS